MGSGDFPASFLQDHVGSGGRNVRPGKLQLKSIYWEKEKIIPILDLDLENEVSKTDEKPSGLLSGLPRDSENQPKQSTGNDNTVKGGLDKLIFDRIYYENRTLMYYVRLCMYAAIVDRYDVPTNEDHQFQIDKVLSSFYAFCDKDKSSRLDEHEWRVGLLTILKYISISSKESVKLGIDSLLPVIYRHRDQKNEGVYCNQQDFQTLLIDTLTEHVRIHTFKPYSVILRWKRRKLWIKRSKIYRKVLK